MGQNVFYDDDFTCVLGKRKKKGGVMSLFVGWSGFELKYYSLKNVDIFE